MVVEVIVIAVSVVERLNPSGASGMVLQAAGVSRSTDVVLN